MYYTTHTFHLSFINTVYIMLFYVFLTVRFGKRHIVTFMIFLGMANAYIMRTNMSVAIVAMVNHTAIKNNDEVIEVEDKCGKELINETNAADYVSI